MPTILNCGPKVIALEVPVDEADGVEVLIVEMAQRSGQAQPEPDSYALKRVVSGHLL